jgi:hypothetical protein
MSWRNILKGGQRNKTITIILIKITTKTDTIMSKGKMGIIQTMPTRRIMDKIINDHMTLNLNRINTSNILNQDPIRMTMVITNRHHTSITTNQTNINRVVLEALIKIGENHIINTMIQNSVKNTKNLDIIHNIRTSMFPSPNIRRKRNLKSNKKTK